jgi:ribosome-binding protein aMBF1 (putative translation factor)
LHFEDLRLPGKFENWNNCSCNANFLGRQTGAMLSKDFAKFFGKVVRKHRRENGLTQEDLAEKSDLAPKMISLVERFQRNPTLNVADSIARGLNVPLWRLVKDTEDLRRKERGTRKP